MTKRGRHPEQIDEVASGAAPCAVVGRPLPAEPLIFPGSFNPLHDGHQRMANFAASRLGRRLHFEISLLNVDKATLTPAAVAARLQQFDEQSDVLLTRAPRFLDKAALAPNATFVVGADTLRRLASPRYYASHAAMRRALRELASRIRGLLVFGRIDETAEFRVASDIAVPDCLRVKCVEVAEEEFRVDLSSTALRRD